MTPDREDPDPQSGESSWSSTAASARQIRETLASNVRRERERAEMSQYDLADATQKPRATIRRVEKAESEPRVSTLIAFSWAFGTPLATLLVGLPEPAEPAEAQGEVNTLG